MFFCFACFVFTPLQNTTLVFICKVFLLRWSANDVISACLGTGLIGQFLLTRSWVLGGISWQSSKRLPDKIYVPNCRGVANSPTTEVQAPTCLNFVLATDAACII